MVLLLIAGAGALLLELHRNQLRTNLQYLNALVSDALRVTLAEQAAGLTMAMQPVAADPRVRAALRAGDAERLLTDWGPLYENLRRNHELTHFYFFDPHRICLLRVHKPQIRGDRIDRVTALTAERTGQSAAGLELGPLGTFTLRVVQPVFDDGTLVGYVEFGKEIEDALSELRAHSGNELAVIIGKQFLDRKTWEDGMRWLGRDADWDRLPHQVVIFATQKQLLDAVAALIDPDGPQGDHAGGTTREVQLSGKPWRVSMQPLRDAAGRELGDLVVMRDVSADEDAFTHVLKLGGAGAVLLLVVLLGFIVLLLRRTDRDIRHQENELRAERDLFSAGPVLTMVRGVSESFPVLQVSSNISAILGYTPDEMLDPRFRYDQLIHPDDAGRVFREVSDHIDSHEDKYELSYRLKTKGGDYRWFYDFSMLVRTTVGAVDCIRSYLFDQSHIKAVETALNQERQRLAGILRGTRAGTWEWHVQTGEVHYNARWAEIVGYTLDELAPLSTDTWLTLVHPDDLRVSNDVLERHFRGELDYYECESRMRHKQGHWVWVQDRGKVTAWTDDGKPLLMQGTHQDITTLKEHQRQLEHIAHYDALTTLPNRVLLIQRLHQAMAQSHWRGQPLAVAYLDLDGFKAINDDHGHAAGDQVLIALATHMKQTLREGDTLARLGGDEFVAVLIDLPTFDACVPLLKRLLAAAASPVQVGGRTHQISASIGVTPYPQGDPVDADQLLRQADQAMYQAKLAGKNSYHLFDAERDRSVRTRHESLERISRALTEREFVLYYQPKVNLRTGTIIGFEALIRWQHPQRGLLTPGMFLPLIEDHPLAAEVGEWVIDSTLTQMEQWRHDGLELPVSVNVGARQLQQTDFVARLRAQLAAHPGIRSSCFELEILETSALEDLSHVSQVILDCRAFGVTCALDDFGTGYSSLTYLKRLPVTQLKIDQSFVRDMIEDPEDLAIVESVVGLAIAFNRQVIAEGMETVAHGALLLQLGCELAQGYGIARPLPAHEIPVWTRAWRPDPSWANLSKASHDDLSLVYARVDHCAWITAIERYLRGERDVLPQLDHRRCRFGIWLDAEERAAHRSQSAFQSIDRLHRQVHTLAARLVDLKVQGRQGAALDQLDELHGLRDALLEELHTLMAH
jgi:diguanylate cyclase (GGDEF)-like protein/PAS domain S-box-containing protein